jgi:hypothetical protein
VASSVRGDPKKAYQAEAHKAHVNLILSGPTGTYEDPDARLTGTGKTGRHLKLSTLDELPRAAVRGLAEDRR